MSAPPTQAAMVSDVVLRIEGLATHFPTKQGVVRAIDGVDLEVTRGEIVGLVGESGSGKTMVALSVLGLVDAPGKIVAGKVVFEGEDLVSLTHAQLRYLRGNRICMIFQDPLTTLSPTLRVGRQMANVIRAHRSVPRAQVRSVCRDALGRLSIPSPEERLDAYPHQLSGGMRQRVCIAMAMLNEPALIIADEPTTALDVTTQAQILQEIRKLRDQTGTAFIWITHDLAVVSELADRIFVMYAGQIVEEGRAHGVLEAPSHPYSEGLLGSLPSNNRQARRLPQIPGSAPRQGDIGEGCKFRPRCRRSSQRCSVMPELQTHGRDGSMVRCFHPAFDSARLDSELRP
jgi:peptide/nickel transport system ATP-binding protein